MKQVIKVTAVFILFIAVYAVGSVRVAQREEIRRLNRWQITNPCYKTEGKWFTQGG